MHTIYNSTPTKNDTIHIETALNSLTAPSLYASIKAMLSPLEQYMNDNIKIEHLSKIFNSNPYTYDYYNYKIDVSTSSTTVTVAQNTDVINGISGAIKDATHCSGFVPNFDKGSTFYSYEFMQNMIDYSIKNYAAWKQVPINKNNIRTDIFQFKLLDLQYVLDNILVDFGKYYMN